MNLFNYQGLQIYYNNSLKRVSINKDGEFMSLTLSTFKLFLTLTKTDSDVNRIKATQNGSDIEILTLYGNFMLTMLSLKHHSTICIPKQIMDVLIRNNDSIELRINEAKKMFIQEPSPKNRIIADGEEALKSKAETVVKYRQSIENVVKSASDTLVKQKDNNNKSIVDFIDHFMCDEIENSCGGGNCTTRNVVETVSGDVHLTPPLMKPTNLLEINVKQASDTLVKQNKKRKRNVITEADGKHAILPLKKSSNLKEINEKQGNDTLVKQNKKRKRNVITEADGKHPVTSFKDILKVERK